MIHAEQFVAVTSNMAKMAVLRQRLKVQDLIASGVSAFEAHRQVYHPHMTFAEYKKFYDSYDEIFGVSKRRKKG